MAKKLKVKFTLEGDKRFKQNLQKLPLEIEKNVMDALNKGALVDIESQAKRNAPVVTGRLRASIHTENYSGQRFYYRDAKGGSYNGSLEEKAKKHEVIVGTNVNYAMKIERRRKFLSKAFMSAKSLMKNRVDRALGGL